MNPGRRDALVVCMSIVAQRVAAATATGTAPLLALLDGDAFMLRGADKLALAEGIALQPDDILDVPTTARLVRIEFADGVSLALGPGSRALLAPRPLGARSGARLYLLAGWAKLGAPSQVAATLLSPTFDVSTTGGTVVLSVQAAVTRLFTEAGEATLRRAGSAPQTLKAGDLLSLAAADNARPELTNRPTPAFLADLPRAFMDALPARADKLRGRPVEPRRLGALAYVDAQPWLDAEPALRRAYLQRWRPSMRDPEFRRGLVAGLKSHPEWGPVLNPPVAAPVPAPVPNRPLS